jgi:ATP-binding cassette, subfamily B, bacterial
MRTMRFPFVMQTDSSDCGYACLSMVCSYYGRPISLTELKANSFMTRQGISMGDLSDKARQCGFECWEISTTSEKILSKAPFPVIVWWEKFHFIVIYRAKGDRIYVADPSKGKSIISLEEFNLGWQNDHSTDGDRGIALLLKPAKEFYESGDQIKGRNWETWSFINRYLKIYKSNFLQLGIGLMIGSLIQLVFPFLTQAIVDKGILKLDITFIYAILLFQLVLYFAATGIDFIRTRIFIHVSTRINIFIISDFLAKLMQLPLGFFDSKIVGDLVQRINDHKRIERFITETLIKSIFSIFTLLVLGGILLYFSLPVFLIFTVGTFIQLGWIYFFLKRLRALDFQAFALFAQDNSKIYEIITGIQEIKINNLEAQKQKEWHKIQSDLFQVSIEKLKIKQYEQGGTRFLSYIQIILIIFFSAIAVLDQKLSLGSMMAILFIVGQLSEPVDQLINFILSGQMAKISLSRLGEIHKEENEKNAGLSGLNSTYSGSITLSNVFFSYIRDVPVLNGVNLVIPEGKVTAIVGLSGSGKTTLLKLLLKFYQAEKGQIVIGDTGFSQIENATWRAQCGTVLQDSYIFSASIAYNISLEHEPDINKIETAAKAANIYSFIKSLPRDLETRIGIDGFGISQGQKQRILIARAFYKEASYLFFDEATNSLDAKNELIIMNNLHAYFRNKTVVVVAHRLSTIKNADQIVVIEDGVIKESGHHRDLMLLGKRYFELVNSQIETGSRDYLEMESSDSNY